MSGSLLLILSILAALSEPAAPPAAAAAPTAVATASPQFGAPPLEVNFDSSESTDPDSDFRSYEWDFGDGSEPAFGPTATHTYQFAGTFAARLTVTDDLGEQDSSTVQIEVASTTSERIIGPDADVKVVEASPSLNFGTSDSIQADAGTDPDVESYLTFTIPAQLGVPVSAKLRLFVYNGTVDGPAVYGTSSTWTETGITWNNRPARTSGAVDDKGMIPVNTWVEYDVTSLISGAGTYSFVLATTSADAASARSREFGASQPQLVLTVDGPPPTATATNTPISGDSAVVLAAGDIAYCGTNGDEATGALVASEPGSVLALGDLAYDEGTDAQFTNCYDPSWGGFKDRTYPVPGNHEYNSPGATGYYNYFGARAGDPTKGYYSYDLGDWHVVALNSNCSPIGGCQAGSAQEQWLRADLAAHPNTCVLAYWHHPLYSSGSRPGDTRMQAMWQALYDYGAEIVLTGHDHHYERFAPQDALGNLDATGGIREFVVGTGGKGLYTLGPPKPNSEVRDNTSHGVLRLVLTPTGYEWTFLPVPGKTFTDSGSASCSDAPPPTPTGSATETPTRTMTGTAETPTETPISTSTPSPTATTFAMSTTYAPVGDARVVSGSPNLNFGSESSLVVDSSPLTESYLRFNVTGLAGPVQSATLRLWVVDDTSNGPPVAMCQSASWAESGLTWANKPASSGSRDDKGVIPRGIWIEYDVTPFITGNGNVCFALVPQASNGVDFSSREGANPPQLVVNTSVPPTATSTHTPVPPTATQTASATSTSTATATSTVTTTSTATTTPTSTATATLPATATSTATATPTSTSTSSATPTHSPPATAVSTNTATPTATQTAVAGTLFSDGFESGNLTRWSAGSGLVVQQSLVATGSWAARGTSTGAKATWARGNLTTSSSEVYTRIRFRVVSRGANELTLLRLETSANAPIISIVVNTSGKLAMRRTGSTVAINSNTTVSTGVWHELRVRLKIGATGLTEVWLNTTRVTSLSTTANLGTAAVARIEIGESATNRTFDVVFDDVLVSTTAIAASGVAPAADISARSAEVSAPTATITASPTASVLPIPTDTAPPPTPAAVESPVATSTVSADTGGTPADEAEPPTGLPLPSPTEPASTATEAADSSTVIPYSVVQTSRSKTTVPGTVAIDGDPTTVWQTEDGADPGQVAVLRLDLGSTLPIDRLRILPGPNGLTGTVTIETSDDGKTWSYFGVPEPAMIDADTWISVAWDAGLTDPISARYVRIVCVRTGAEESLGGVAEVEVLPPAESAG